MNNSQLSMRLLLILIFLLCSKLSLADTCSNTNGQELKDPPTINSNGFQLTTSLSFQKAEKCINGQTVALRSYVAKDVGGNLVTDNQPVGPAYIIELNENDTGATSAILDVTFSNDISPSDCNDPNNCVCDYEAANSDIGYCTNIHTHGFRVSPNPHSDDVLVIHEPGVKDYQYTFALPDYHAPGTHWLHAHLHGSTAPQVSEGVAAALILKGELDNWLENTVQATDKIMILQQLRVDNKGDSLCGEVTTAINGQCVPKISAAEGDILRMRLIHAGISETVGFGIQTTSGEAYKLSEFARDGITLGEIWEQTLINLQPGYRSDLLFQVPKISEACPNSADNCVLNVVDNATKASDSLMGEAESEHIIATLYISPGGSTKTMPDKNDPHFAQPYAHIEDSELVENDVNMWFASISSEGGKTQHTVMGKVYPDKNL